MAPEVLRCPLKRHPGDNKTRTDLHYATAVDAWAVGVLAFELLTGRCVQMGIPDLDPAANLVQCEHAWHVLWFKSTFKTNSFCKACQGNHTTGYVVQLEPQLKEHA
jgi:hypothetical protein